MPGLCCRHCSTDCLIVSHFTQLDDIRCLSETRPQSCQIILRINGNFSLTDQGLVIAMQLLNRILQRYNMCRPFLSDLVNDARLRRGLTTACRTGKNDHAVLLLGNEHHLFRDL